MVGSKRKGLGIIFVEAEHFAPPLRIKIAHELHELHEGKKVGRQWQWAVGKPSGWPEGPS